ncbi:MAG: hypothetical protein KDK78_11185, partial [Chlamydiia bacterium]|nr:hypothetical protein [Chlamydiia bacterium]
MAHLRTLIFLFVCCPLLVFSQEAKKEPPTPWSLSPGWWQELTESQPDEADKKVKELIQSLQSLDSQVAADSKELVRVALDAISKNINQYLQLRKLNGWVIEAAPAEKQSYTIDDLLNAAKQLKLDQATLQEASDDVKRLESVLVQAIQRVDELNVEYAATAGKSLQRTVAGLNVMVAVTGRAVVEQRLRVAREKQGGIEQRVSWSKAILASAKDRLDLSSIDSAALERDVASATGRETTLQAELLQIEADLLPTDAGGHVDTQLLRAVNKLISFAQAQIQIIMGRAKMALVTLAKGEESRVDGTALIENARSWIKDLDKLEKQEIEWKKLIRREQDAIERRLLGAGGEGTIPQDEGAEFLRRAIDTLSSLEHLEVERFQTSILAQQAS